LTQDDRQDQCDPIRILLEFLYLSDTEIMFEKVWMNTLGAESRAHREFTVPMDSFFFAGLQK